MVKKFLNWKYFPKQFLAGRHSVVTEVGLGFLLRPPPSNLYTALGLRARGKFNKIVLL